MTREEQIQKLDSMAKPRSEEAIRKAEERKKQRQGELYKIAMRYAQDELKDNHSAVENVVAAAFLNGIDYAEHHPHWISVKDEGLPTKDGCYLFYAEGEPVYMCYYYADFKMSLATHWMPLPEPPKKGGAQ